MVSAKTLPPHLHHADPDLGPGHVTETAGETGTDVTAVQDVTAGAGGHAALRPALAPVPGEHLLLEVQY